MLRSINRQVRYFPQKTLFMLFLQSRIMPAKDTITLAPDCAGNTLRCSMFLLRSDDSFLKFMLRLEHLLGVDISFMKFIPELGPDEASFPASWAFSLSEGKFKHVTAKMAVMANKTALNGDADGAWSLFEDWHYFINSSGRRFYTCPVTDYDYLIMLYGGKSDFAEKAKTALSHQKDLELRDLSAYTDILPGKTGMPQISEWVDYVEQCIDEALEEMTRQKIRNKQLPICNRMYGRDFPICQTITSPLLYREDV